MGNLFDDLWDSSATTVEEKPKVEIPEEGSRFLSQEELARQNTLNQQNSFDSLWDQPVQDYEEPQENFFEKTRNFISSVKDKIEDMKKKNTQMKAMEQAKREKESQDPRTMSSTQFKKNMPKPGTLQEQAVYDATLQKKQQQEEELAQQYLPEDVKNKQIDIAAAERDIGAVASSAAAGIASGSLGVLESALRTPEAITRAVGHMSDMVGVPQYGEFQEKFTRFIREGYEAQQSGIEIPGLNDLADKLHKAHALMYENQSAFKRNRLLAEQADRAFNTLYETGNADDLLDVVTNPAAWSGAIGQAVPSLITMYLTGGRMAVMFWLEAMGTATDAIHYEQLTGQRISDEEFTEAAVQAGFWNMLLEKYGFEKVFGGIKGGGKTGMITRLGKQLFKKAPKEIVKKVRPPKFVRDVAVGAVAEGLTEALQEWNSNLASMKYNKAAKKMQGVLMSFMGGFGAGGGLRAATFPMTVAQYNKVKADTKAKVDSLLKDVEEIEKKGVEGEKEKPKEIKVPEEIKQERRQETKKKQKVKEEKREEPIQKPQKRKPTNPLLIQQVSDIYKETLKNKNLKSPIIKESQWIEQMEELIDNPERFHFIQQVENPRGLQIGDKVRITEPKTEHRPEYSYVGTIVSTAKEPTRYSALIASPENYGGWVDINKIQVLEKTKEVIEKPKRTIEREKLELPEEISEQEARELFIVEEGEDPMMGVLRTLKDKIIEGEAGGRIWNDEGKIVGGYASTFPEWFKNKGINKEALLKAIDNALEGKPVTKNQAALIHSLLPGLFNDLRREIEAYEKAEQEGKITEDVGREEPSPEVGEELEEEGDISFEPEKYEQEAWTPPTYKGSLAELISKEEYDRRTSIIRSIPIPKQKTIDSARGPQLSGKKEDTLKFELMFYKEGMEKAILAGTNKEQREAVQAIMEQIKQPEGGGEPPPKEEEQKKIEPWQMTREEFIGKEAKGIETVEDVKGALKKAVPPKGYKNPNWSPLEMIMDEKWLPGFMFMGSSFDFPTDMEEPFATKRNIYSYKHGITRKYIHIDEEGLTYEYRGGTAGDIMAAKRTGGPMPKSTYVRIPQDQAIEKVFEGLEDMGWKRTTAYDDEFKAGRDKALEAAGWTILRMTPKGVEQKEPPAESHKEAVRKAILEGKDVPPEVLKDYPDLEKVNAERNQQAEETPYQSKANREYDTERGNASRDVYLSALANFSRGLYDYPARTEGSDKLNTIDTLAFAAAELGLSKEEYISDIKDAGATDDEVSQSMKMIDFQYDFFKRNPQKIHKTKQAVTAEKPKEKIKIKYGGKGISASDREILHGIAMRGIMPIIGWDNEGNTIRELTKDDLKDTTGQLWKTLKKYEYKGEIPRPASKSNHQKILELPNAKYGDQQIYVQMTKPVKFYRAAFLEYVKPNDRKAGARYKIAEGDKKGRKVILRPSDFIGPAAKAKKYQELDLELEAEKPAAKPKEEQTDMFGEQKSYRKAEFGEGREIPQQAEEALPLQKAAEPRIPETEEKTKPLKEKKGKPSFKIHTYRGWLTVLSGNPKFKEESKFGLNVGDKVIQVGVPAKSGKQTLNARVDNFDEPIEYVGTIKVEGEKAMAFKTFAVDKDTRKKEGDYWIVYPIIGEDLGTPELRTRIPEKGEIRVYRPKFVKAEEAAPVEEQIKKKKKKAPKPTLSAEERGNLLEEIEEIRKDVRLDKDFKEEDFKSKEYWEQHQERMKKAKDRIAEIQKQLAEAGTLNVPLPEIPEGLPVTDEHRKDFESEKREAIRYIRMLNGERSEDVFNEDYMKNWSSNEKTVTWAKWRLPKAIETMEFIIDVAKKAPPTEKLKFIIRAETHGGDLGYSEEEIAKRSIRAIRGYQKTAMAFGDEYTIRKLQEMIDQRTADAAKYSSADIRAFDPRKVDYHLLEDLLAATDKETDPNRYKAIRDKQYEQENWEGSLMNYIESERDAFQKGQRTSILSENPELRNYLNANPDDLITVYFTDTSFNEGDENVYINKKAWIRDYKDNLQAYFRKPVKPEDFAIQIPIKYLQVGADAHHFELAIKDIPYYNDEFMAEYQKKQKIIAKKKNIESWRSMMDLFDKWTGKKEWDLTLDSTANQTGLVDSIRKKLKAKYPDRYKKNPGQLEEDLKGYWTRLLRINKQAADEMDQAELKGIFDKTEIDELNRLFNLKTKDPNSSGDWDNQKGFALISPPPGRLNELRVAFESLFDIESPLIDIGAPESGLALKNYVSKRTAWEERALKWVKDFMNKYPEITGKDFINLSILSEQPHRVKPDSKYYKPVQDIRKMFDDMFEELKKAAPEKFKNPWPISLIKRLKMENKDLQRSLANLVSKIKAHPEYKALLEAKIQKKPADYLQKPLFEEERVRIKTIKERITDNTNAISFLEENRVKFVHLPVSLWFQDQMQKNPGFIKLLANPTFKAIIGRGASTIQALIESGMIDPSQADIRNIVGVYQRYIGSQFAELDILKKGVKEGLVLPMDQAPENWIEFPIAGLDTFRGMRLHPTFASVMENYFQGLYSGGLEINKVLGTVKMLQFYNPLFLPAYDLIQSAMAGVGIDLNLAKGFNSWVKAIRSIKNKDADYWNAYDNGLFSTPYLNPFETFLDHLEDVKKSNDPKAKQIVDYIKKFFTKEALGQVYNLSWTWAWRLDKTVRLYTYHQLLKEGFTPKDAAQTGALFHADYAAIPPKTRKVLNRIFFTPSFKIAMTKLHKRMIESTLEALKDPKQFFNRSVDQYATNKEREAVRATKSVMASALLLTVGFMFGRDLIMRTLGFRRDQWARRYSKQVKVGGETKEIVVTMSAPDIFLIRYWHKLKPEAGRDYPDKLWTALRYELHPLYQMGIALKLNQGMDYRPIYNDFDPPQKQVKDALQWVAWNTIRMSEEFIMDDMRKDEREQTRQALKDSIGTIQEAVMRPFIYSYIRNSKDRRLRGQLYYLEKKFAKMMRDFPSQDPKTLKRRREQFGRERDRLISQIGGK